MRKISQSLLLVSFRKVVGYRLIGQPFGEGRSPPLGLLPGVSEVLS
jgi:hypothetical protein